MFIYSSMIPFPLASILFPLCHHFNYLFFHFFSRGGWICFVCEIELLSLCKVKGWFMSAFLRNIFIDLDFTRNHIIREFWLFEELMVRKWSTLVTSRNGYLLGHEMVEMFSSTENKEIQGNIFSEIVLFWLVTMLCFRSVGFILDDIKICCQSSVQDVQKKALYCWKLRINEQTDWKQNHVCFQAIEPLVFKK